MINVESFTYTDEQWNAIKGVVFKLGVDADQIASDVMRSLVSSIRSTPTLRDRIELAAGLHIMRSAFEGQTPGQKARIKQLTALRDRAEALRDDIIAVLAPSITINGNADRIHRIPPDDDSDRTTHRAIAKVVSVIDASIAAQRPRQTVSSRKTRRNRFWEEMLAIWTGIGGAETRIEAARFLIAVSGPVFDKVRAIGGSKTAVSALDDEASVVEWLRLRKARRAATS